MNKKNYLIYFLFLLALLARCSDKDDNVLPPSISGIEKKYTVLEGDELELKPLITNDNSATYSWLLEGKEVSKTLNYIFDTSRAGEFNLILKVSNAGGSDQQEIKITVVEKGSAPIISEIEDEYTIEIKSDLILTPAVTSETEVAYSWLLEDKEVSKNKEYLFNSFEAGKYSLFLKVTNKIGTTEKEIIINVVNTETIQLETSAYTILTLETPDYLTNLEKIQWEVLNAPSELYRLSYANTADPMFIAAKEGTYYLQVSDGIIKGEIVVTVKKQVNQLSSYISKVFDYLPAPGQFVNELPKYTEGDTHADMVKKTEEWLVGEEANMITLGGWGGYVTFGFDHTIVNVTGKRDFRINGNAFGAAMGRPGAPFGGSCEPGIIMVAYDKNKNGKPDDDEWYEIKGSSNFSSEKELWYTIAKENGNDINVYRDYEMTYYKPAKEKADTEAEPDNPLAYVAIKNYIRWEDNKKNSGYKVKNVYHNQTYYPAWVKEDKLTYKGIRLPENGVNEGQFTPGINEGNVYFVLYGFSYGYADNYPNVEDGAGIDIDWAIDKDGNKADLPGIDFVKIYNGVNQENGWLGECSTEVERGEDLHMLGKNIATIKE